MSFTSLRLKEGIFFVAQIKLLNSRLKKLREFFIFTGDFNQEKKFRLSNSQDRETARIGKQTEVAIKRVG